MSEVAENQVSVLFDPVQARRDEVAAYQQNIDTFKSILATLPSELPPHLEQFRNRKDQHVAITEIEDLDDVELLSQVWFYEEVKGRIRSEMVEQTKAKSILAVLESQTL